MRCASCGADNCRDSYARLVSREYKEFGAPDRMRLTTHTYPAQHPGPDSPGERKSVAVNLVGLCLVLEQGLDARAAHKTVQRISGAEAAWPYLEPPHDLTGCSASDVLEAANEAEHDARVLQWAAHVWSCWSAHHTTIRQWCQDGIPRRGLD